MIKRKRLNKFTMLVGTSKPDRLKNLRETQPQRFEILKSLMNKNNTSKN